MKILDPREDTQCFNWNPEFGKNWKIYSMDKNINWSYSVSLYI